MLLYYKFYINRFSIHIWKKKKWIAKRTDIDKNENDEIGFKNKSKNFLFHTATQLNGRARMKNALVELANDLAILEMHLEKNIDFARSSIRTKLEKEKKNVENQEITLPRYVQIQWKSIPQQKKQKMFGKIHGDYIFLSQKIWITT